MLVVELQTIQKKSLIIVPVNAHNAGGQLFTGTVPSYLSRPTVGYQVLSLLDSMIKNNNVVCYYYYIEPPMTQLIATTVNDTVDCS